MGKGTDAFIALLTETNAVLSQQVEDLHLPLWQTSIGMFNELSQAEAHEALGAATACAISLLRDLSELDPSVSSESRIQALASSLSSGSTGSPPS